MADCSQYLDSIANFNAIQKVFVDAVLSGVRGQDVSNALISSKDMNEFVARVQAHSVVSEAQMGGGQ